MKFLNIALGLIACTAEVILIAVLCGRPNDDEWDHAQ